jgi:hypothetical protein
VKSLAGISAVRGRKLRQANRLKLSQSRQEETLRAQTGGEYEYRQVHGTGNLKAFSTVTSCFDGNVLKIRHSYFLFLRPLKRLVNRMDECQYISFGEFLPPVAPIVMTFKANNL